jgi:hypothetical protein
MNNRTLWQLTADGVADIRDNQEELLLQVELKRQRQRLIEDLERSVREQRQVSVDELVSQIFQSAKSESDRSIKRHDFELSSGKVEGGNHKVYTVR